MGTRYSFFGTKKPRIWFLISFLEKLWMVGLVAFLRKKAFLESFRSPQFHYGWNVLGMALTILRVILMND